MNTLTAENPGVFATVQDLGRRGYAHLGVPPSGAADELALRLGNRVLGNPPNAAAVEITLGPSSFIADSPTLVCITGAPPARASIDTSTDARPIPHGAPVPVPANARIAIDRPQRGWRTYLCVAGGVDTPPVLNSRSAHTPSGLGSPGSRLEPGHVLPIRPLAPGLQTATPPRHILDDVQRAARRPTLRLLPSSHTASFPPTARGVLTSTQFTVQPASNRVGIRLNADTPIPPPAQAPTHSEATLPGFIQVPPDGSPIILGPDGPTTGGYPVIATVVLADRSALAQLAPGDTVAFAMTTPRAAADALRASRNLLDAVAPPAVSGHLP